MREVTRSFPESWLVEWVGWLVSAQRPSLPMAGLMQRRGLVVAAVVLAIVASAVQSEGLSVHEEVREPPQHPKNRLLFARASRAAVPQGVLFPRFQVQASVDHEVRAAQVTPQPDDAASDGTYLVPGDTEGGNGSE